MNGKQLKGKFPKRGFPWLWVTVVLFIAAFAAIFLLTSHSANPVSQQNLRAAIVDQLYTNYLNEDFTAKVTQELEDYGFGVDVYQGGDVTVDLYQNLPRYGYKLIIFRTHSGLMRAEDEPLMHTTALFTNEPYSKAGHFREQINEELLIVEVWEGNGSLFFGITPKFISNSMQEQFDNAVIIITGCSCLRLDDLAQSFVGKGASVYLAWDATVDLEYVDHASMRLLHHLCASDKLTIAQAVDKTMLEVGPDPKHGAVLKYYPLDSGSDTIAELIS